MSDKPFPYGGQAVIEGVMFGGRYAQVTAIQRKNGDIECYELEKKEIVWLKPFKQFPFVRGLVSMIESSVLGTKHMQYSSQKYDLDQEEEEMDEPLPSSVEDSPKGSKWEMILGVAIISLLSLIIGKAIFTALPAYLASILFDKYVQNLILQNLIEGAIKTVLLLGYLLIISQTSLIKRVYQYHGAEHKVINAFEHGEKLTVENVQKHSTLHYRCGSSFIVFTIIVGVIVYSFFSYDNVWERIGIRLLLIPVVIGLSYEVLRLTNWLRDKPVLKYMGYPGLWLQKLTTKEPTDEQVKVAITAFEQMRKLDAEWERNWEHFLPSDIRQTPQ
nr:DUF1385 domain-containing protein [Thermoactinomyces mirandus]